MSSGRTFLSFHRLPLALRSHVIARALVLAASLGFALPSWAVTPPATPNSVPTSFAPEVLPGHGLAEHPFLCCGENDQHRTAQTMSVVRNGKVVWTYSIPMLEHGEFQEIGSCFMRPDGNIVFARMHGVSIITPDKKIIWNYDAPPDRGKKGYFPHDAEIHVVSPAGPNRILMVISKVPESTAMIINTKTGAIEKKVNLPTPNKFPHLNFRRVHLTREGTLIAAHLQENKVVEYDFNGKVVWSYPTPTPWSVVRLNNGNTLITGNAPTGTYVHEVNKQGAIVWEFSQKDVPDIKITQFDEAARLANGNTTLVNWPVFGPKKEDWPQTVQVLEVTPAKKVVWALRSWTPPNDLGPLSAIQLLDQPGDVEKLDYQR